MFESNVGEERRMGMGAMGDGAAKVGRRFGRQVSDAARVWWLKGQLAAVA